MNRKYRKKNKNIPIKKNKSTKKFISFKRIKRYILEGETRT